MTSLKPLLFTCLNLAPFVISYCDDGPMTAQYTSTQGLKLAAFSASGAEKKEPCLTQVDGRRGNDNSFQHIGDTTRPERDTQSWACPPCLAHSPVTLPSFSRLLEDGSVVEARPGYVWVRVSLWYDHFQDCNFTSPDRLPDSISIFHFALLNKDLPSDRAFWIMK